MELIQQGMQLCGIPNKFLDAELNQFNCKEIICHHMMTNNNSIFHNIIVFC